MTTQFSDELTAKLAAGFYCLGIRTPRIEACRTEIIKIAPTKRPQGTFIWRLGDGLKNVTAKEAASDTEDLLGGLIACRKTMRSTVIFENAQTWREDDPPGASAEIAALTATIEYCRNAGNTIIFVGPRFTIPPEIQHHIVMLDFPMPDESCLNGILDQSIKVCKKYSSVFVAPQNGERDALVQAGKGLTDFEFENALMLSVVKHVGLHMDPTIVQREKVAGIKRSSLLEIVERPTTFDDVGGLEHVKQFILRRKKVIKNLKKAREAKLDVPKGIMLIGVPGAGKSFISIAIANALELPLLSLDIGRLFGSLVGQSEQNTRTTIEIIESVAPCCLLIEEIEKGFSGTSEHDGGTSMRVFGTFLTWLQDRNRDADKSPVFIIATANDVSALRPEFLRKGRWDEIFFVDLPNVLECRNILSIHLKLRNEDPNNFKVAAFAEAVHSKGFTGSEIEQAIVTAKYDAYDEDRNLTNDDIKKAVTSTIPLAVTMRERIATLREWAITRARPASEGDDTPINPRNLAL